MTYGTVNVNRIVDASGGVLAPISSVMRNRIINGAMVIDQRNAGASVTITSSQFGVDRMSYEVSQASKLSAQQNAGSVTPPVGFVNYQGTTSLSAYSSTSTDYFWVRQNIEGYNTSDLNWGTANAKTVTVSFWAYSSLTGSFSATLCNDSNNRCFPFSYSIPVANTWTYITQTVTGDTTGTWATTTSAGIRLIWNLGTGSSRQTTGGAWVAGDYRGGVTGSVSLVGTNGATFYITGVQLERGTQATSFEYRQYGQELALCQRYFVNADGKTNNFQPLFFGTLYNTTSGTYMMNLPVTMRTIPVITSSGTIYAQNLNITISSLAGPYSQAGSLLEGDFTLASGSTSGNFVIARWNNISPASRSFNISAEL
jgi:hypothetical protein